MPILLVFESGSKLKRKGKEGMKSKIADEISRLTSSQRLNAACLFLLLPVSAVSLFRTLNKAMVSVCVGDALSSLVSNNDGVGVGVVLDLTFQ